MSSKTRQQAERQARSDLLATVGERLRTASFGQVTGEDVAAFVARYWEAIAFGTLVVAGAVFRFWNLGARALHHDESLHSFYAYGFATGKGFDHVPFMHGTFQFIGNGIVMKIWPWGGPTDFSARVMAATLGTLMILLIYFLRDWLTRPGAFAAAVFVAISPTLMYFSRFTREDIYTGFWTLGLVVAMWRYLADRREVYLYLAAAFLSFSFATKESTYLTAGLFIIYLNYLCTLEFAPRIADSLALTLPERRAAVYLGVFPIAWAMVALWPLLDWDGIGAPRRRFKLQFPAAGPLLLVLGTLTLPQLAALSQKLPGFTDHGVDNSFTGSHILASEERLAKTSVVVLLLGSLAVGAMHDWPRLQQWADYLAAPSQRRRPVLPAWFAAAVVFWAIYVVLYTTFFTNPAGFWSGIWGGFDYWISQQHVRRGDQPDYYYFILLPLYEFLPLLIAFIGALYYAFRGSLLHAGISGLALFIALVAALTGASVGPFTSVHIAFMAVLGALLLLPMPRFTHFLLFWLLGVLFGLSVAGEKMPWLNVHIALPLAILGGDLCGRFLAHTDLRADLPRLERWAPFLYAALATALATAVFIVAGPTSPAAVGAWLLVGVAVIAVGWAFYSYTRLTALQVAAAAGIAALFVFTLRASVLASWGHPNLPYLSAGERDHGDTPVEMLVYTQTSPDIPRLMSEISRLAEQSGLGKDLPVVVDQTDSFSWPWAWYLREYKKVSFITPTDGYTPPAGAVLLINKSNISRLNLQGANLSQGVPYRHRWWFPETYRGLTTPKFFKMLREKGTWSRWRSYFIDRTLTQQPGSVDGVAYFPQTFESALAQPPSQPVESIRTEDGQVVIGGPGIAPGQFQQPDGLAVDKDGNLYVADSKNNRVQVFKPDGHYLASFGLSGNREGEMSEPWGVAVDSDGNVYVADTWNWRIQKFDKDFKFEKAWGKGGQDVKDLQQLFGPRALALDANGDLLVVDTGNKRIVRYSVDGEGKKSFGKDGSGPGEFKEPVGIAIGGNGDIYVADTWNGRVQHFDRDFNFVNEIKVDGWSSTYVTDKPYLAVTRDGTILASVPAEGKVLVFDQTGKRIGSWTMPSAAGGKGRPVGLAVAPDGQIWVSDSLGNVVRKLPLTALLGQ